MGGGQTVGSRPMERHSHGLEFELDLGGSRRPRHLRAAPWDVWYKTEHRPHRPPLMIQQRRSRGRGSQGVPASTSGPPRPQEAQVPWGQPPGTLCRPRGPQGPFPRTSFALWHILVHLADSEWPFFSLLFVKLFVPVSFEVDGIRENQTCHGVNWICRQQVSNFTCKEDLKNQLANRVSWWRCWAQYLLVRPLEESVHRPEGSPSPRQPRTGSCLFTC